VVFHQLLLIGASALFGNGNYCLQKRKGHEDGFQETHVAGGGCHTTDVIQAKEEKWKEDMRSGIWVLQVAVWMGGDWWVYMM
jgi:hypothetical protein